MNHFDSPRRDSERLVRIEQRLKTLTSLTILTLCKENSIMALGQDILDAVTAEDTKVDSFIALVTALIADSTIPADVGAAILAKVKGSEDKLDAAITANTTPPTS
jgi:hypothetical protein